MSEKSVEMANILQDKVPDENLDNISDTELEILNALLEK